MKKESFNRKGIGKLEEHWGICITLEDGNVDKKSRIFQKKVFFWLGQGLTVIYYAVLSYKKITLILIYRF